MQFRSRADGSHYPVHGKSLFNHPPRSRLYHEEIRWDTPTDARRSVAFANGRWDELGAHQPRVHLMQAMNQAANRAKVSKGENSEEYRTLRKWVEEHKAKTDPPFGKDPEVFRGFDDAGAKNAEAALKKKGIPFTITHSTEGSKGQFKMVEFHTDESHAREASSIIDEEINGEPRTIDY